MIRRTKSDQLFAEALKHIPGGVNSPVRAFRAVGGQPFFVNKAKGAHIWDVDGNEYVDYVGTWGPAILGHAHPKIIQAVRDAGKPLLFLIGIQGRVFIVDHSRNIEQFRHGSSDLQDDGAVLLIWDILSHIVRKRLQKQPRRKCHPFERRRLVSVHAQPQASIAARRERYVWLNWPK